MKTVNMFGILCLRDSNVHLFFDKKLPSDLGVRYKRAQTQNRAKTETP